MPKAKKEAAPTQDEVRRDPSLITHTRRDCLFTNLVSSALYISTRLCLLFYFQNFGQVDIVSKDPRTVVLMLDSPEPLVQAKACEALLKYMQQCELKLDVWLQHTHTHTHTLRSQQSLGHPLAPISVSHDVTISNVMCGGPSLLLQFMYLFV